MKFIKFLVLVICLSSNLFAQDWPIYKGNIYFTGNNDEIIVKNSNLKWLFQAEDRVFNPVVSDGRIYFIDRKAQLYCLDEEYGFLIWKKDIRSISKHFRRLSRAAGKIKYPLIFGDKLLLTDPVAIYALNKYTGKALWARTGMRMENTKGQGLTKYKPLPMVDGIYSDPVIRESKIFYGTRNMFISRELRNGHQMWENRSIKSFSGFPTFYDEFIFTQSMNFETGRYTVHCLNLDTGNEIWSKRIIKPMKIYPPVIYKQKVYIPTSKELYCLNLKDGSTNWIKDYKKYITSVPGFTDRAILFSLDNSNLVSIDPDNGNILRTIKVKKKSGPKYVMVRDQAYIAYSDYGDFAKKRRSYGVVKAINFSENSDLWNFRTPFPGAISQPVASGGILFLPAGNYLYAIGAQHYARVVQGGSGYAVTPKKDRPKDVKDKKLPRPMSTQATKRPVKPEIKTRKMQINIADKESKKSVPAQVTVKKRKNGRIVYEKRHVVSKPGKIDIPVGDNVEVTVSAKGYVPKKEIVNQKDKNKNIWLDKIETGKSYVVDNVLFEFNKAYLKSQSLDVIDGLVRIMKQNPALKVEIRGYTDNKGKSAYNQKLSERRADAVAEYVIKQGVSPERISSVGFGEKNPIADNNTKAGRQKNRRTEFYFKK
jgi:outer membrane protein OmpA-like peptidoglycan-associated protein/outer membrane protein assembly factor BamB